MKGICVLIGAITGGAVSETIGFITAPLEEKGLKEGLKEIMKRRPQLSYSVRSVGPTVLGFLAYEYTKEGSRGDNEEEQGEIRRNTFLRKSCRPKRSAV